MNLTWNKQINCSKLCSLSPNHLAGPPLPQSRWKFKVPQGPIRLFPYLPAGIPCAKFGNIWSRSSKTNGKSLPPLPPLPPYLVQLSDGVYWVHLSLSWFLLHFEQSCMMLCFKMTLRVNIIENFWKLQSIWKVCFSGILWNFWSILTVFDPISPQKQMQITEKFYWKLDNIRFLR